MNKLLLLLPLFWFPQLVQGQIFYSVQKTSTSATSEAITVQSAASSVKFVKFYTLYVDCSTACTVQIENGGTAASATSLAITNINARETAAVSTAYSASNVGSGNILQVASIPAGGSQTFDISRINFTTNRLQNLTTRVTSASGTYHITYIMSEQ